MEQIPDYDLPTAIFVRPGRSMRVRFTTATKRDCQIPWNRSIKIPNVHLALAQRQEKAKEKSLLYEAPKQN